MKSLSQASAMLAMSVMLAVGTAHAQNSSSPDSHPKDNQSSAPPIGVSGDALRHIMGAWQCQTVIDHPTGDDHLPTHSQVTSLERYEPNALYVQKTTHIKRGDTRATYHIDTKRDWYITRINDNPYPTLRTFIKDIERFDLDSTSPDIENDLQLKNYLEKQVKSGAYEDIDILELSADRLVLGVPWHDMRLTCQRAVL